MHANYAPPLILEVTSYIKQNIFYDLSYLSESNKIFRIAYMNEPCCCLEIVSANAAVDVTHLHIFFRQGPRPVAKLIFAVITCFCYVVMISLDHKKVRFSHFFQMCSKLFQINF